MSQATPDPLQIGIASGITEDSGPADTDINVVWCDKPPTISSPPKRPRIRGVPAVFVHGFQYVNLSELSRLSESAAMERDAQRYGYCNAETPPIIIVATSSGNTATRPNYLDETRVFGRWTMVQNTVERGRDKAAQSVQNPESYEEIGREDQNLPKRVIFLFAPSVLQTAVT
ncbi:hypothetical protein DFH09DRAFT_1083958 [Mycena vulgaris]|nr:hypothetical protein DFH09DRAFT_1083958 [Mycena vulgaris]